MTRIRFGRGRGPRAALLAALASAATVLGATACGRLDDALSPGRASSEKAPARLSVAAELPTFARGTAPTLQLGARVTYLRTDGSGVPLTTQTVAIADVATQQIPLTIDLATCLGDAQRRGAELGNGADAVCDVLLELTLLDGTRTLDQQTVGPLRLRPGGTTAAPAVSLFEVASVRLTPPASTRLEIGETRTLVASVVSTSGQTVAGRAVTWASDAPNVARVDASTGVVTALAAGRARITAAAGGQSGTVELTVVPRPSPIAVGGVASGGSGSVRSLPAGIDCRIVAGQAQGACTATFPGDAQVTLTAAPDAGSFLGAWTGACAGSTTTCVLPADQARTAAIGFSATRQLAVGASGTGTGSVTSAPAGITCRIARTGATGTCSAPFRDSTSVTLTAAADAQQLFVGWSGDCASATGATCTVSLAGANRSAVAQFAAPNALAIGLSGNGAGTVTATAGTTSVALCALANGQTSGTCSANVAFGTRVSLTATPDAASNFAGWTGACSGSTTTCQVTLDQARTVGAVFTRQQVRLTLGIGGGGTGSVLVNGATACTLTRARSTTSCTLTLPASSVVRITAFPAVGSSFALWGGACATVSPCTLTLQDDATVDAAFILDPGVVVVSPGSANVGSGTVTSIPAAIACTINGGTSGSASGTCEGSFPDGGEVTLSATPVSGMAFVGWGGACAAAGGQPTCTLTIPGALTLPVTAAFAPAAPLNVFLFSDGRPGQSTVSYSGVTLPPCTLAQSQGQRSCDYSIPLGVTVTLVASPAGDFNGWDASCDEARSTATSCVFDFTYPSGSSAFGSFGPSGSAARAAGLRRPTQPNGMRKPPP